MAAGTYTILEGHLPIIRILQLLPSRAGAGDDDDELQCSLEVTTLDEALPYIALSYVWENYHHGGIEGLIPAFPQGDVLIRCNGELVKIGANLSSALRRLRDKTSVVRVWVDSLCINQQNVRERTHQVGLMRKIYEGSQEVVIWLGDRPPDRPVYEESLAFAIISRIAEGGKIISKAVFQTNLATDGDGTSITGVNELVRMMDVSWWRRIWVVQETVVSRIASVYYGELSLPWTIVVQAAANFASELGTHPMEGFGMGEISQMRDPLVEFSRTVLQIETTRAEWMSARPATLLSLLRKFRSRESTDSRDKVFALLGLVKAWERSDPMIPDYARSTAEVLWMTTVKIIVSTQSLSVLEGTIQHQTNGAPMKALAATSHTDTLGGPDDELFTIPAVEQKPPATLPPLAYWVVDWTVPPMLAENERLSHFELFDASSNLTGLVQLHGTSMLSILEVQGFVVDEIRSVGEAMPTSGFNRIRASVRRWLGVAFTAHDQARTHTQLMRGDFSKGSQLETFAMVLCGGLVYRGISNQPDEGKAKGGYRRIDNDDFKAFRDWSHPDRYQNRRTTVVEGVFQGWTDVEANQRANSLQFAIETSSCGRAFFTSKKGYMGVGPASVRSGDLVCVVLGCRVPLILRRRRAGAVTCQREKLRVLVRNPDGSSKSDKECSQRHQHVFEVIGDAYVHGIMDGEIVRGAEDRCELPSSLLLV